MFEQQVVEEVMPVNNGGELEDEEVVPVKGVELKPARGDKVALCSKQLEALEQQM